MSTKSYGTGITLRKYSQKPDIFNGEKSNTSFENQTRYNAKQGINILQPKTPQTSSLSITLH